MQRVRLLGIPVDLMSMDETVALAIAAMRSRSLCRHVALNVAKFVKMRHDSDLQRDVIDSDIIGIDGMGIVLALRLLGCKAERVSGVDLMEQLIERCATEGLRPYILGARRDVLDRAIMVLQQRHPKLEMAGSRDGYFKAEDEDRVVAEIASSGADCLFVAMPTPRKERFLFRNAQKLKVPFIMGVGGSVDVIAGHVNRAPGWMQAVGLEWFYRFLQEPRKMWWRYASTNSQFAIILIVTLVRHMIGRPALERIERP